MRAAGPVSFPTSVDKITEVSFIHSRDGLLTRASHAQKFIDLVQRLRSTQIAESLHSIGYPLGCAHLDVTDSMYFMTQ